MNHHTQNIADLIGSRICHDLISPIGAVSNGLELLALAGTQNSPEMNLVADSAASANARIRLFRLAFGVASPDQVTRADEIKAIWSGVYPDGRISLVWSASDSVPRRIARLVVLSCLCAEIALPQGGRLVVSEADDEWRITAIGEPLNVDPVLWDTLTGLGEAQPLQPAHVQFLLLPQHLSTLGREAKYEASGTTLTISF